MTEGNDDSVYTFDLKITETMMTTSLKAGGFEENDENAHLLMKMLSKKFRDDIIHILFNLGRCHCNICEGIKLKK